MDELLRIVSRDRPRGQLDSAGLVARIGRNRRRSTGRVGRADASRPRERHPQEGSTHPRRACQDAPGCLSGRPVSGSPRQAAQGVRRSAPVARREAQGRPDHRRPHALRVRLDSRRVDRRRGRRGCLAPVRRHRRDDRHRPPGRGGRALDAPSSGTTPQAVAMAVAPPVSSTKTSRPTSIDTTLRRNERCLFRTSRVSSVASGDPSAGLRSRSKSSRPRQGAAPGAMGPGPGRADLASQLQQSSEGRGIDGEPGGRLSPAALAVVATTCRSVPTAPARGPRSGRGGPSLGPKAASRRRSRRRPRSFAG